MNDIYQPPTSKREIGAPSDSFMHQRLMEQIGMEKKNGIDMYMSEYGDFEVEYVFLKDGKKFTPKRCSKCGQAVL
jgi:hypothetical protein